jgi:uncharacterized protein
MMKNPIGWIEIPVTDLERAEKFYADFLGWKFDRQEPRHGYTMSWFSPMEMESYGSAATLMLGEGYIPSHQGTMIYFSAPESVETTEKKAGEMGVKVLIPKMNIGEHGFFAAFEDSEGNRIAVHSMKG